MEKKLIYLDNSATTKICPEALEKYNNVSLSNFGNPSSLHARGLDAEKEINGAKSELLTSLGARDSEVVFTASGSEANNLAILGRAYAKERYKKGKKIITTMGEHASVAEPFKKLEAEGYKVAYIPTKDGCLDLGALASELTPDVILVSIMMVNNETGARYDTKAAADLMRARSPEAVLHLDATQSYLKFPFTKASCGADMITVSSHKIEGPKGVGALIIDGKIIKNHGLAPLIYGGGQGLGLRSGTENVPGIAAFGAAIKKGYATLRQSYEKMESLRTYLIERISSTPELLEISLTLPKSHAPHILNLTLPSIKSETMLHYLSAEGIFVSSGSACSSHGHGDKLHSALVAYGRSEAEADCSVRVSLCPENEKEDIDALCTALAAGILRLARIKR